MRRTLAAALGVSGDALGRGARALGDARRVAAFLAGRVAFEPRSDDVFIATYPRSGTTLMQWVVYLLSRGGDAGEPGELRHLNEVSPWFERGLAIGSVDAHSLSALKSPRLFKTHLTADWVPKGPRAIAVVRDGPDVAASYYHFYRAYLGFEGSFDAFFKRFLSGRLQYGSWFSHVAGWERRAQAGEALLVRYEGLLEDRAGTVRRVAEYLGWSVDDAVIERVVAASSFEAMKAREASFDHATALLLERGVTPASFIRAGKAGEGQATLDAGHRAAFEHEARHATPRRELWLPPFLQ